MKEVAASGTNPDAVLRSGMNHQDIPPHVTVLDSGVTVISQRMAGRRQTTLGFWVPAGSCRERPEEAGISHLLEHMHFKGTKRRTARDISVQMEAVGAEINGYTEREFTCYYCSLLGDDLPLAVDVLTDMVCESLLAPADLELERNVVLEEIAKYEDSPDEIVHDLVLRELWNGHPLGQRILGQAQAVRTITRERLLSFVQRFYSASQTVVTAAGDVDHEELVRLLAERYQTKGEPQGLPPTVTPEVRPGRKVLPDDTEQAYLCLGASGASRTSSDRYPEMVLCCALGGGTSSRLFQTIREQRGLAYNVGAYAHSYAQTGALVIYAGSNARTMPQVLELSLRELRSIARDGLEEEELSRTKRQLIAGLRLSMENPANQVERLARSYLYHGRLRTPAEMVASIESVTAAQIIEIARRRFDDEPMALAAVGDLDERSLVIP